MSLSCIISSNNKIKYETVENNPDWLNKVPWYNTTICSKLHGTVFEYFIRNSGTDRYNFMSYITSHDRKQPTYVDFARSDGGISIPKNATTAALKSLGANIKFIDCWLKYFQHNYQ